MVVLLSGHCGASVTGWAEAGLLRGLGVLAGLLIGTD